MSNELRYGLTGAVITVLAVGVWRFWSDELGRTPAPLPDQSTTMPFAGPLPDELLAEGSIGRYQLVASERQSREIVITDKEQSSTDGRRYPVTLRIDTATGKVWQFVADCYVTDRECRCIDGFQEVPEGKAAVSIYPRTNVPTSTGN